MNILVALSLAIAAGMAMSRVAKLVHLPNVTAYLVAGLLFGPSVLGLISRDQVAEMSIITTVALGFIAFSIGAEFKLSYLKQIGSKPISITFFQGMMAAVLVDAVLILLGFDLPLALTLGAIATATAPAATLMVVQQYRAKGPVSGILLPVVAMDDALGLMIFSISTAVATSLANGQAVTVSSMLLKPLLEIVGSLALGFGLGLLMVLVTRFFHSKGNRLSLTIMAVFAGVGLCEMWGLSSLLVCMMIGATLVNLSPQADQYMSQTDQFTPPLFLLFFVISGADLDLSILPSVGLLGVAYLIARSFGKWFGAWLGSTCVHAEPNVRKYLGFALLPQAGVAIGMAQLSMTLLPQYGSRINAVVLAATLVYELVGPVITKIALTRAGEIEPEKKHTRPAKSAA